MKIIVDANIIFSAILNSNGKIGDLLINSEKYFVFVAPEFLRFEIKKYHNKLCKISGLSPDKIRETEAIITRRITFISEDLIEKPVWVSAAKIVENIDPNDTPYIALSKHLNCKIWSGDKALMKGLTAKKIKYILSTDQLYKLRENKMAKKQ